MPPRLYREPDYRRRLRQKAEQQENNAKQKEREAAEKNRIGEFSAAIHRIEEELRQANDQDSPHKRS